VPRGNVLFHTASKMDGIPSSILDETPAMLPPDGQTTNFINPPDIYMISVASSTLGLALTIVFVGIRLYTKCFLLKKLYWEDCEYSPQTISTES
jgi:hypothetical protein